jgi:flagellar basal body-associated protein FliL
MEKVTNILKIVYKVIIMLGMTCVTVISMASAYILFAPDEFPKPFYLNYLPDATQQAQASGHETEEGNSTTPKEGETPAAETTYAPGDGIMFNMATKIINLADAGARKYIRLTMVLEFAPTNPEYKSLPEEEKLTYMSEFEAEIENVMPIMDDVVITHLSTKTFEDLYTANGKEMLRTELITAISERIEEFHLISVYFTEFVVQ